MITLQEIRDNNYQINNIEVKQYLPLSVKKIIIMNILDLCIEEIDDVKTVDYAVKEFAMEYHMLNQYTNIDFDGVEDLVSAYDELKENGVVKAVFGLISDDERMFIHLVLKDELRQIMDIQNSVGVQLNKIVVKLIAKIPNSKEIQKLMKNVTKEFKNLDPTKLEFVNSAVKAFEGK